ncbi:MAG: tetratricopeptide repeat protein [Nitrospirae bacterium]|nr:tetratricopeptide repeat protein [Nitrospirota bacterium]
MPRFQPLIQDAVRHLDRGHPAAAMERLRTVLRDDPDHAEANHLAALVLAGGGDLDGAAACLGRALARDPRHGRARAALAKVLFQAGRLEQVAGVCQEGVRLLPRGDGALGDLFNAWGAALAQMGQFEAAADVYRKAIRREPDNPHLHHNLGNALKMLGDPRPAAQAYRRAAQLGGSDALAPLADQLRAQCAWDDLARVEPLVLAQVQSGTAVVPPFGLLMGPATAAQQRACAEHYAARCFGAIAARAPGDHGARRRPKERLTIGYLSADFHGHATAYLAAQLFELHDRAGFEVLGYSLGPDDGSPMRRRIAAAFDRFADVRAEGFEQTARRIHDDGVDILVDLKGYTQGARTEILALRPAPVQVNYLGYPGTMGAPFMDYLVGDPYLTPHAHQAHFSERIVQLPGCYQVNDRARSIADSRPSRAGCGLPESAPVVCCFNHLYKITAPVFGAWMDILRAVPGAVLWLLEGNGAAMANLRRAARGHGVDPARIVFAPKLALAEHLARIRLADLFLDTHPCNAHTTASDALWAGLPLLTLSGETFASRVAGSLLSAVGLPELIASDLDGYRGLAVALARDPERLAGLRARLAAARDTAPLFDSARFTHHLEAAYRAMWARFAAGEAPAPITIGPLP